MLRIKVKISSKKYLLAFLCAAEGDVGIIIKYNCWRLYNLVSAVDIIMSDLVYEMFAFCLIGLILQWYIYMYNIIHKKVVDNYVSTLNTYSARCFILCIYD